MFLYVNLGNFFEGIHGWRNCWTIFCSESRISDKEIISILVNDKFIKDSNIFYLSFILFKLFKKTDIISIENILKHKSIKNQIIFYVSNFNIIFLLQIPLNFSAHKNKQQLKHPTTPQR